VPFPLYVNLDINGDGVSNNGHSNDRPTCCAGGRVGLVGRYPFNQPNYAEWDARLQKDFPLKERYHVLLQADFFNVTNHGNTYSNPDIAGTFDYATLGGCTARGGGQMGFNCAPLTKANFPRPGVNGYRTINQIAPGTTPFAFQAGAKFTF
jgi:hypothetical protein